jgi:hypothetical protein
MANVSIIEAIIGEVNVHSVGIGVVVVLASGVELVNGRGVTFNRRLVFTI